MRLRTLVVLGLVVAPSAGLAQQMGDVGATRALYDMAKDWLIRSAEQMPEENYAFKPTPEVRSFGQLIGHVSNASYMFCSAAKGEKSPSTSDFEKTTSKAALVKAIKDAFAYCDGAYQITDAKATEEVTLFEGMKGSKLWILMFNVAHDTEHYGNIVTYLRIKGLVPPSSQGGM
jgi:uncharacterized damage-inducible protein DinB